MWYKARGQPSQGVASRSCVGAFQKNRFVYVSSRGGAQGIQCTKAVQGGNLVTRPA
jgi:hypothetical protein